MVGVVIPARFARSRNDSAARPWSRTRSQAASTIASRADRRRAFLHSSDTEVLDIARNIYTLYKPYGQARAARLRVTDGSPAGSRLGQRGPVVTAYGVVAVTFMMVMYAMERRRPTFVLLFAFGCVLSSVYGFLSGAWPFGVVELVWAGIAVARFRGDGVAR